MHMRGWARAGGLSLVLGLLFGCDNPTDSGDHIKCEHVDADGLVVELLGGSPEELLASQWQGTVSGQIELALGETLTPVQVTFLDADSARIVVPPSCTDHRLEWEVAETGLVTVTRITDEPWQVTLAAVAEGETTIRFRVWHGDHADFTSLPIPLHVHAGVTHEEPFGLTLLAGAQELLREWEGAVSGRLEAAVGVTSLDLELYWLDEEGEAFQPGAGYSLGIEIGGAGLASVSQEAPWVLAITGAALGTTTIRFSLLHEGHSDYSSAEIPVDVLPTPAAVEAVALYSGGTHGVSWNYDGEHAASAEGVLLLEASASLAVRALGEWIAEAGHGASHREEVLLPNSRYRMEFSVASPALLSLASVPYEPRRALATAGGDGSTSVVVRIFEGDALLLETGALPVIAAASGLSPIGADWFLKKNGVRIVYGVNGQLVDQPAGCAGPANPGWLETTVGASTDLYWLKYLADGCGQTDIASGRLLTFLVEDPSIAAVTNHPLHWGERSEFHLEGLSAGSTTLRFALVRVSNLSIELVSPPIPVEIAARGAHAEASW